MIKIGQRFRFFNKTSDTNFIDYISEVTAVNPISCMVCMTIIQISRDDNNPYVKIDETFLTNDNDLIKSSSTCWTYLEGQDKPIKE